MESYDECLFELRGFCWMALSKKGSGKIVVDGHEFRWRARGDAGRIHLILWPVENVYAKVTATLGYHSCAVARGEGGYCFLDQVVITNRVVRQIILSCGVERILGYDGTISMGAIENIFDIRRLVRGLY
ncbi:MAG: hypothetical protein D6805_00395, partial [Planctomycetota bacterium]